MYLSWSLILIYLAMNEKMRDCLSDCLSEIFAPLSRKQRQTILKSRKFLWFMFGGAVNFLSFLLMISTGGVASCNKMLMLLRVVGSLSPCGLLCCRRCEAKKKLVLKRNNNYVINGACMP